MLGALVRLLVGIALAAGLGPIAYDILRWSARGVSWHPPDPLATLAGAAAGLAFLLWRRPNRLIHTTVHELCHLVVCVLVLVRPTWIAVSSGNGGRVEHVPTDPVRATLIQIAPYTLPLLLTPVLLARQFFVTAPGQWREILAAAAAFLFVTHLQALYHNVRINFGGDQSDLAKVGRPLSVVLIALALMLVTAWTLRVLWSGVPVLATSG